MVSSSHYPEEATEVEFEVTSLEASVGSRCSLDKDNNGLLNCLFLNF